MRGAAAASARKGEIMAKTSSLDEGVVLRGGLLPGWEVLLTAEAIGFAAEFERQFGAARRRLL